MLSVKGASAFVLLLLAVISAVKSQFYEKESKTAEEVEHIFEEIEENHNKLRNVFKEAVFKETPTCQCVPFYLCKIDEGKVITDGTGILKVRLGSEEETNPCEGQDVCCMPSQIGFATKIGAVTGNGKCGYGIAPKATNSDNNQPFTEFGEFPWTIMIANFQEGRGDYKCVGSLIHPQVVLTAAHCIEKTETIIVRAGEWNRKTSDEPKPHESRLVNDTIKHPKFRLANLKYNVALLITETPFELDEHINTACLTSSKFDASQPTSEQCVATGWGVDKPEGRYSAIMRKMRFLLIDSDECQSTFRKTRLGQLFNLHHTFLCASNKYGSDACEGNGGGPLVCPIEGQPGRYQQVGITSWGIGCGGKRPSVFTNLPEIKNWIDEQFDKLGFSKDYYTYGDNNNSS